MSEVVKKIQACQEQIESAYAALEASGRLGEALSAYQKVEHKLKKLGLMPFHAQYREGQRVLAACLLRQGQVLGQFERLQEAAQVRARQLAAARASGDLLTLAQALMTTGAGLLAHAGLIGAEDEEADRENGRHALDEARRLYESGESESHRLGLGDYWVVVSKLIYEGYLGGGTEAAREAAERAVEILGQLNDQGRLAAAQAARLRAMGGN